MKRIDNDIASKKYSQMYLLYGDEDFNKRLYVSKLKKALMEDADMMNCNIFTDNSLNEDEIISVAQTMPFFAERRVIIIENSNYFKESCNLIDYFESFPDTTFFIFSEKSVDKRSKMYKYVKANGYAVEISTGDEETLLSLISTVLRRMEVTINRQNALYIIQRVGTDMYTVTNECKKLASYVMGRENKEIQREDIDTICSVALENKIFDMLDDLAYGRRDQAMKRYMDLLELREAPAKILRLITRHYNILLLLSKGRSDGLSNDQLCKLAKVPSFTLKKYMAQLGRYDEITLRKMVETAVDYEEGFKTGKMTDQMAVDMLMCTL